MNKLSEKTWVSLSLVIAIIGGVFWLASMFNQTHANAADINEIKSTLRYEVQEINDKLDFLIKHLLGI